MNIWKKVCILFIFIIFVYILYRLIKKRIEIKRSAEEGFQEGATTMPTLLRDYYIKSSMDSAYDGTEVSIDQIEGVILDGYRFVDLHVFLDSGDSNAYVIYSPDEEYTDANNKILLQDIIPAICKTAFAKTNDNYTDPFFLQIRPGYYNTLTTDEIDSAQQNENKAKNILLNNTIETALRYIEHNGYKLAGPIETSTTYHQIKEKIVVVMPDEDISESLKKNWVSITNDKIRINKMDAFTQYEGFTEGIATATTTPAKKTTAPTKKPKAPMKNPKAPVVGKFVESYPFDADGNLENIYKIILQNRPNYFPNFHLIPVWYSTSIMGISTQKTNYEKLFDKQTFAPLSVVIEKAIAETTINNPMVGV